MESAEPLYGTTGTLKLTDTLENVGRAEQKLIKLAEQNGFLEYLEGSGAEPIAQPGPTQTIYPRLRRTLQRRPHLLSDSSKLDSFSTTDTGGDTPASEGSSSSSSSTFSSISNSVKAAL
ncbi:hypothetical protein HK102_004581, partial [Quaeritorhiza haematococci]